MNSISQQLDYQSPSLYVIHKKNIQTEKELSTLLDTQKSPERIASLAETVCVDLDVVLRSHKKTLDQYTYYELDHLHNVLRSRLIHPAYIPSRRYVETLLSYTRQINKLLDTKLD